MVQNWAELKYGKRFKKLAKQARERVRARHPEREAEEKKKELKDCLYHTLTDNQYSKLAWTVGAFLGICIALSTVAFVLETVPEFEKDPQWGEIFFHQRDFFRHRVHRRNLPEILVYSADYTAILQRSPQCDRCSF